MEIFVGYTPEKMPLNHGPNPERHRPRLINSPTVIIQSATFLFICGHLVGGVESLTLRKIIASSEAMNLTPSAPLLPPVGDQSKQIVQCNHLSGTQRHHSSLLAGRWPGWVALRAVHSGTGACGRHGGHKCTGVVWRGSNQQGAYNSWSGLNPWGRRAPAAWDILPPHTSAPLQDTDECTCYRHRHLFCFSSGTPSWATLGCVWGLPPCSPI